ncbi:hypothetical protein P9A47_gp70 [Xanthomonas phage Elanor]|uniref:Uncharacterized protein n=1 Tax=Xanthomonas phage Elanor TaxID=2939127 RepID=A0A9E7E1S6_9CAUD|nr:hypothetical protein P9A47_gp70 [Xanthomonas phage Elanor]URA07038.1 hypothetical protein Elanor_BL40070 [Xanthomonas phage Elanor]
MKLKQWISWAAMLLLTGGAKSPLRVMEEGKPYRIVRHGRGITLEQIAGAPAWETDQPPRRFEVGQRVVSTNNSGFHKGAHGVVQFQEFTFQARVWVLRDGATQSVFFYPYELELESLAGV